MLAHFCPFHNQFCEIVIFADRDSSSISRPFTVSILCYNRRPDHGNVFIENTAAAR